MVAEEFAREGVEHIADAVEPNGHKVVEKSVADIEGATTDAARLGLDYLGVCAVRAEQCEGGVPKRHRPSGSHSVGDAVNIYRCSVDNDMEEMVAAHVIGIDDRGVAAVNDRKPIVIPRCKHNSITSRPTVEATYGLPTVIKRIRLREDIAVDAVDGFGEEVVLGTCRFEIGNFDDAAAEVGVEDGAPR